MYHKNGPAAGLLFALREKYHTAHTMFQARGLDGAEPLPALEVNPQVAAQVLAFEARLFKAVERYGLRGANKTL